MDHPVKNTHYWTALVSLVCWGTAVQAIPVRPTRTVAANTVRRAAAPPTRAQPPARVALQLSALRISDAIPMRAMLHAIARDSWPALVACVQTPRPRGVASVTFHVHGRTVTVDRVTGGPVTRDATLRRCLTDAVSLTHAPAHPQQPSEADVVGSFDLSFDLPPL
jgi:hypothetical protein